MPKMMIRPSVTEPDPFEPDYMMELEQVLQQPIVGEDGEPGVRTPKPLRNLGWDDFAPGEVRHEWADDCKRPPKADKSRK